MISNKKIILSALLSMALMTGCSVKPEPIKQEELTKDVNETMDFLIKTAQPVTKPITLDEAIQRAIDNNLNKKLDVLNSVIAEQKIDIVSYEALPSLTTKAGYTARDSYAASQSTTFKDGRPGTLTDSYSVSQEKESITSGVGFSWNVLDFGLSYVRANQQANRFLMAKERERKSIYNIKQEVRTAYYQAVSADELLKRVKPLVIETKKALEDSQNIAKLKLESPMRTLTYQRELLEVIRSLNTLEENLVKSKTELSKLMGLKPGIKFELAEKIKDKYQLPKIKYDIDTLEKMALEHRPELQEARYQEKISQDEVRAVMLKMLPGVNFNAGYNYDNSNYLMNNDWLSYGTSVSWNLVSVFKGNMENKLADAQIELAKQQKIALSMAVISQVHLSMLDLQEAKKEYYLSEEYFKVAKEIFKIIENENNLNINGNLSLIKEKLNYLISNLRLSSSYAKVQNAYGKVISSIGEERLFEKPQIAKKEKIAKNIEPKKIKEHKKVEATKPKEIKKVALETPVITSPKLQTPVKVQTPKIIKVEPEILKPIAIIEPKKTKITTPIKPVAKIETKEEIKNPLALNDILKSDWDDEKPKKAVLKVVPKVILQESSKENKRVNLDITNKADKYNHQGFKQVFLEAPKDYYTIHFNTFNNPEKVPDFVDYFGLENKTLAFTLEDKKTTVLKYRIFKTKENAIHALNDLTPYTRNKYKPFVEKISIVQAEYKKYHNQNKGN